MRKAAKQRLIAAAVKARRRSVAPYSNFSVGAAILAGSGKTYLGANVESASYGLTCCAERIALFKALTEGERAFRAIAVAAPMAGGAMPCGACRQLLAEYASTAVLITVDSRAPDAAREFAINDLLPEAFTFCPPAAAKTNDKAI